MNDLLIKRQWQACCILSVNKFFENLIEGYLELRQASIMHFFYEK